MNEYVKSDLYRYYGGTGFLRFCKLWLVNSAFRFQTVFRLITRGNSLERFLGGVLWLFYRHSKRYQVSKSVTIGYGLYIGHHGPIIMHNTTIIGNNCNLSQNLTIGSNEGKSAVIGDNVYIGPNVCVVEDVRIGNNATIGAGSVVVKDIPENATAAGNYAKVLNYNAPGRYIKNRWEIGS